MFFKLIKLVSNNLRFNVDTVMEAGLRAPNSLCKFLLRQEGLSKLIKLRKFVWVLFMPLAMLLNSQH